MKERNQNEFGIGLIEVTIALIIFLVALITLAQAATLAILLNKKNRENLTVTTLCKDKIEQLLSLDFDDVSTNTAVSPIPTTKADYPPIALVYPSNGRGLSTGGSIAPDPPDGKPPVNFYCDYLDALGQRLDTAVKVDSAIYIRQWKIEIDPTRPVKTIRVTVIGPSTFGLTTQASMVAYKTKSKAEIGE